MKIDIWSDIACPFCYKGKRQFEAALERFEYDGEIEVEYHSFELDPSGQKERTDTLYQMLESKYGRSEQDSRALNERMFNDNCYGLEFNFDDVKLTNTFDAHRLTHFAKAQGKQVEVIDELFKAYFTDGQNISNHEVLVSCAQKVGLDINQVRKMLDSQVYFDDVRNDERQAKELGITGVPMFVINMENAISGAQGEEAFLSFLNQSK